MDVVKFTILILAGIFANQVNAQHHATPQQVDQQSDAQSIQSFSNNNNTTSSSTQNKTNNPNIITNTNTTVVLGNPDSVKTTTTGTGTSTHNSVNVTATNTQVANNLSATTEDITQGVISGQLYIDLNENCIYENSDATTNSAVVKATDNNGVIYSATPSSTGWYSLTLPLGAYQLSLELSNPYLDVSCTSIYNTSISTTNPSSIKSFAFKEVDQCPFMQVDLDVPIIQSCYPSVCTVNYCNLGNDTAQQAYVEIELDTNIIVDSTSIPYLSLGGNTYLFDLGDVAESNCGSFYINVHVPCDTTLLGETHCIEAHIFPDTTCESTWTGPILDIEAICANGMISFAPHNVGAPMPIGVNYIVIQDDLMIQPGGVIVKQGSLQLGSGQMTTISLPFQQGGSYRFQLVQSNGVNAIADVLLELPINNCAAGVSNQDIFYSNSDDFFTESDSPFSTEICKVNGTHSAVSSQVSPSVSNKSSSGSSINDLSDATTELIEVQLYPNPMDQMATIKVTGDLMEDSQFRLYDLTGRQVMEQTIQSKQFNIYRNNLASGYYFYKIESAGKISNIGKVILR
ncbi:MAG: T9SS type A sorting domain-containing protein [Aureispira sp.]|nr:T9SS type A sorting domain-containing protein [Aureispira sp.]